MDRLEENGKKVDFFTPLDYVSGLGVSFFMIQGCVQCSTAGFSGLTVDQLIISLFDSFNTSLTPFCGHPMLVRM